jgi:periplasmic protein TonB
MFFLNNNDSIRQNSTSFMNSNLSMTSTQPSFFESWFIGEDRRHLMGVLFFILVLVLHLGVKAGFINMPPIEPPKMKIVEVELLAAPPPPVAPPAPITPPTPPKPEPPKPKPVPPKPKTVPKPKPKPVEVPKPDDFKIPEPLPIKTAPTPPVPYTPPAPPRPAAPAPSRPAASTSSSKSSISAHCVSSCGKPPYPSVARQRGWEGTVRVKIQIAKDGSVTSVSMISSSGYDVLDDAAMDKIRDMEFNEIDDNIIRTATQSINFKLDN